MTAKEAKRPASLREAARETILLTCESGHVPVIERVSFGGKWVLVELDDGRAGRAFSFGGEHAVYGQVDFEHVRGMRVLAGMAVDAAIGKLLDEADALDAAFACAGEATDVSENADGYASRTRSHAAAAGFNRSVALAAANALSCNVNAACGLRERGFELSEERDYSFLRPDDAVVLIGAGMLMREARETCASVDVIDMRAPSVLYSASFDAEGDRLGPANVRFHGPEDTRDLVERADVVGVTGCALANESLFEVADMIGGAREFVVFGPSAQLPMELFERLGVTRVATSRVTDAPALVEGMLTGFESSGPRDASEGYVVSLPREGVACAPRRGEAPLRE